MIRLPDTVLPLKTTRELAQWQRKIDRLPNYETQVSSAKELWAKKPIRTFSVVRNSLEIMHGNQCRCGYCESSEADEVEHIQPKDLYPESTFVWDNYLFACGLCNRKKENRYAVFIGVDEAWTELQRPRTVPIMPPVSGEPLLINPRREDPLDLLRLEIAGDTFEWKPKSPASTRDWHRAKYTIDTLGLNSRDSLLRSRRDRYHNNLLVLSFYAKLRDSGKPEVDLQRVVNAIRAYPHPSVWQAMKRQHGEVDELNDLILRVPEAMNW